MSDATERLINLALYLASTREYVTAERVRDEVDGYPAGQDEAAFIRMFERDKDELRAAGLDIVSDAEGRYRLDTERTFASTVSLSASETASLRLVAASFTEDPAFPFAEDLRLALAKLATGTTPADVNPVIRLSQAGGVAEGQRVAALDDAVTTRKRVEFDYVNALGQHKHHVVEGYGLFVRDMNWYLVARDTELDEVRVYTVSRISDLQVSASRPKSADYSVPDDFDVGQFIGLPFQYGPEEYVAALAFDVSGAPTASALAAVSGTLEVAEDGSVQWRVKVRDTDALCAWVIEHGPGVRILEPRQAAVRMRHKLAEVVAIHGD